MLQAYALNKFLSNNEFDSEIIDFRPDFLDRYYRFHFKGLIFNTKQTISLIVQFIKNKCDFKNFELFLNNNIVYSKKRYLTEKELLKCNYDVVISGSDQIWNPGIIHSSTAYLLSFAKNDTKKMAYASSFGVSKISEEWSNVVKQNLKDFHSLGLRENTGKEIISNILPEKSTSLVLDPVFLLDYSHWDSLISKKPMVSTKYILLYSLEDNNELNNFTQIIAKKNKLKIVSLHPIKKSCKFADVNINNAGPIEFLSLIKNAEYICTNSFHGTSFSIIFDKKFISFQHSSTGSRVSSLLKNLKIGVEEEIINGFPIPVYVTNSESKESLDELKKSSRNYLLENLSKIRV